MLRQLIPLAVNFHKEQIAFLGRFSLNPVNVSGRPLAVTPRNSGVSSADLLACLFLPLTRI
jgi:hypothetical protein